MDTPNRPDAPAREPIHLFTAFNVPVRVKPPAWPYAVMVWGGMILLSSLLRPARPLLLRPLAALLYIPFVLFADLGHALAHSFSARIAGTPMKEILIDGMPRTLYADDDVPPHVQERRAKGLEEGTPPGVHITRALGGPVFSGVGLALSLIWRALAAPDTLARELAEVSIVGHGFIFGSGVIPLPFVDAGSIVKWALVKFGFLPYEADKLLRLGNLGMSAVFALAGVVLMLRGSVRAGLVVLAVGGVALGAGLDKIK
ncbi:MAG: hypothetical protein JXB47_11705 [Anaerolineae bacterium]|nr:hypothetical protein [Anaerolineae bacterium]